MVATAFFVTRFANTHCMMLRARLGPGVWTKIEERRRKAAEISAKRIATLDADGGDIPRAHPDLDKTKGFGLNSALARPSRHPTLGGHPVEHPTDRGRYGTAVLQLQ